MAEGTLGTTTWAKAEELITVARHCIAAIRFGIFSDVVAYDDRGSLVEQHGRRMAAQIKRLLRSASIIPPRDALIEYTTSGHVLPEREPRRVTPLRLGAHPRG